VKVTIPVSPKKVQFPTKTRAESLLQQIADSLKPLSERFTIPENRDGRAIAPETYQVDLSTPRNGELIAPWGFRLVVEEAQGKCSFHLNRPEAAPIDPRLHPDIHGPFERVFLTNTAQAGRIIKFLVYQSQAALLFNLRSEVDRDFTVKIENDGNGNPVYVGKAPKGAATSAAVWQVRKLSYDVNQSVTDVQFAGGSNAFDKIYDNRATFTYS